HVTVVDMLGISLWSDTAGLRERHFREVGFVEIDLNLQVLGVCARKEGRTGTLVASKALWGYQFVFVGQLFEDYTIDGRANDRPFQLPPRKVQQALSFSQTGF